MWPEGQQPCAHSATMPSALYQPSEEGDYCLSSDFQISQKSLFLPQTIKRRDFLAFHQVHRLQSRHIRVLLVKFYFLGRPREVYTYIHKI